MPGGEQPVVEAAGGIVWRAGYTGVEVMVIHRDRYDDWTFPKGKLEQGEGWEQAAVREVWEETGVVAVLGPEVGAAEYRDHRDRAKRVRYWAMTVAADTGFVAGDEVTARAWLGVQHAARELTYEYDRRLLDAFCRLGIAGGD